MSEQADVAGEFVQRTADIDYIGTGTMEDWFDDVVEVFDRHGCEIQGSSDGPTEDSWYERLLKAEAENEGLRTALTEILRDYHLVDAHPGFPGKKMINAVRLETWQRWQAVLSDSQEARNE